jgi:hypothetical protein
VSARGRTERNWQKPVEMMVIYGDLLGFDGDLW